MSQAPDADRAARLDEFLRRLTLAPPAASHDEALAQVARLLNAVEDEMTSIPFDPTFPLDDGRMYPPLADSRRPVPGRTDVVRYRSKAHSILVGANGAIRIVAGSAGPTLLTKPGADGRTL